jgi:hypothetical protein
LCSTFNRLFTFDSSSSLQLCSFAHQCHPTPKFVHIGKIKQQGERLTIALEQIAAEILNEEANLRFISFRTEDAVTIGMNLRKRFRSSTKHARGRGAVISIQVR